MTRVRRSFSKEKKAMILDEFFRNKCSMIEIGQKYYVDPVTLARWKRNMSDKDPGMNHSQVKLIAELEKEKEQNKLLRKLVADLSIDKEILNEALDIYKKKSEELTSKSQKKSKK